MPTITERANNLKLRFQQITNQNPERGVLGDIAGALVYDTTPPNCVIVRVYTSNGLSGPRIVFMPININIVQKPGTPVLIGWQNGRQSILGPDTLGSSGAGVNSTVAIAQQQTPSAPQATLATLKIIASATPDKEVHFQAWNVIINNVYYDASGLSIDLTGAIPAAGDMCFAVIAVKSDFTTEYAVSTARSMYDVPLSADDINEALPSLSSGSTPVWAVALQDNQSTIAQPNIDNTPSRDLRQVVNSTGVYAYTPTNSADTTGLVGDFAYDDNFLYVKTAGNGWTRSALSTF